MYEITPIRNGLNRTTDELKNLTVCEPIRSRQIACRDPRSSLSVPKQCLQLQARLLTKAQLGNDYHLRRSRVLRLN